MPFPILAVVGLCKICVAVGGAMFCTHQVAKAINKHTKNKKDKLALKGKTIEQASEDNK
ncbi:98_t:CDS:1, partial [Entrophospora sp. SA101]